MKFPAKIKERVVFKTTEKRGKYMKHIITARMLEKYQDFLQEEEKSGATIKKYMCDLQKFLQFIEGREVSKKLTMDYKERLLKEGGYKISSINSYLVAVNRFLEYQGWYDAKVKTIKIQQDIFSPEQKYLTEDEYKRLINTAYRVGRERIALIIQTIGSTGIRVSELAFISVDSLKSGMVEIHCKGKVRRILLPRQLQRLLRQYIKKKNIRFGAVFQTAAGKAIDRSNIWREMKQLCEAAGVEKEKVFPHNLRHLFARTFYNIKNDIAKLADVLGHSSIETTRIYMKSPGNEHRKQLDSMKMVIGTT